MSIPWTRCSFQHAVGNIPLTNFESECVLQRLDGALPFTSIVPALTSSIWETNYQYENYEAAKMILGHISDYLSAQQIQRIVASPYFSAQMDGSTDIGQLHTFTMDIRYLIPDGPSGWETVTEFLELRACGGRAKDMTDTFLDTLAPIYPNGIVHNYVGMAVDGASAMTGEISGVGVRVQAFAPASTTVHCAAHRGALVMKSAAGGTYDNPEVEAVLSEMLPAMGKVLSISRPGSSS
jgi:hypothetical protein